MSQNIPLKELIVHLLNEIKEIFREYAQKQEDALKRRLKRFLIFSIATAVFMSLGISMAGSASLFFLIGSLRYLETFLPAWQAWFVVAAGSAVTAAVLFILLFLLIRSQLSTRKASVTSAIEAVEGSAA